jgi:hypothetical protein
MKSILVHFSLAVALTAPLVHAAPAADNQLTIVFANGPFADTYKPPTSSIICMHAKAQNVFSVGWKDFNAAGKSIAEAGMEVSDPDSAGAKLGEVEVGFGSDDKKTVYKIFNKAMVLTLMGKGGKITFDGKTDHGIGLHIEAICNDVTRL